MWVVSLAFTASLWANLRAPESVPVVAPTPIAAPAPKAVL